MPRSTEERFVLDHFLVYQLTVLAGRLSRGLAEHYRRTWGISIPEWRVVAHLSQSDAVSVREIHAKVDMDKSKVSRAATRLEEAGYITKRSNPDDRRLVELALTRKGRAMMADLAPVALAYEARVLAQLGPDRASTFREATVLLLEDHE